MKNDFPPSSLSLSLWTSLAVYMSMLGNHGLGKLELILMSMLCPSVLLGQTTVLIVMVVGRIMAPPKCQYPNFQYLRLFLSKEKRIVPPGKSLSLRFRGHQPSSPPQRVKNLQGQGTYSLRACVPFLSLDLVQGAQAPGI